MAYIDQARKKQLEPAIKALLKEYGLKGSLRISHHSTLYLTISQGPINFIGNYNETTWKWIRGTADEAYWNGAKGYLTASHHHLDKAFSGTAYEAIDRLLDAMNQGNHDRSDITTDYFDVGWYAYIEIGKWNKPYICTAPASFEKEAA